MIIPFDSRNTLMTVRPKNFPGRGKPTRSSRKRPEFGTSEITNGLTFTFTGQEREIRLSDSPTNSESASHPDATAIHLKIFHVDLCFVFFFSFFLFSSNTHPGKRKIGKLIDIVKFDCSS